MGKHMLRATAIVAVGLSFGVAGDAADKEFKKELQALAGTWRPIASETEGKKAPEENLKESRLVRDASGKIVAYRGDKVVMEAVVRKIDLTKTPRTLDAEVTAGQQKGTMILGIYELNGDTLPVCVSVTGKDRPTEFSAKAGTGHYLTVYKRDKK